MAAEDLIAVVFQQQLACAENLTGEREVPDHPLVKQTLADCLHEAMDVDGLTSLLRSIEGGETQVVARDLPAPSPLAAEILTARPYAYLDDAPLEERRTQAVASRRWLDPESAAEMGQLDPAAIAAVRAEAWPEAGTPDELHDVLVSLGFVTAEEGAASGWSGIDHSSAAPHAAPPREVILGRGRGQPLLAAVHPHGQADPRSAPPNTPRDWTREGWSSWCVCDCRVSGP
jgi:ATP-dependent Lhr-like helicase